MAGAAATVEMRCRRTYIEIARAKPFIYFILGFVSSFGHAAPNVFCAETQFPRIQAMRFPKYS